MCCVVARHTGSHRATPFHTMSHHDAHGHAILHLVTLGYTGSHRVAPCCNMSHYVAPCHTMSHLALWCLLSRMQCSHDVRNREQTFWLGHTMLHRVTPCLTMSHVLHHVTSRHTGSHHVTPGCTVSHHVDSVKKLSIYFVHTPGAEPYRIMHPVIFQCA